MQYRPVGHRHVRLDYHLAAGKHVHHGVVLHAGARAHHNFAEVAAQLGPEPDAGALFSTVTSPIRVAFGATDFLSETWFFRIPPAALFSFPFA